MTIDWQVDVHAQLPSTQDYLRDLVMEELPEGTVIQSLSQAKGRGRQGREWHSPIGNLYMSVLLRPECEAAKAGQMSFVAGIAVSAAIDSFIEKGHIKTLKWPNDVMIDGKKCAGILIESSLSPPLPPGEGWGEGTVGTGGQALTQPSPGGRGLSMVDILIVGIGVNILAPPEGAIGLGQISGGRPVPVHVFRDKVLEQLESAYLQWKRQGFSPIRTRWLKQAHAMGETITARFAREEAQGLFKGIDEKGALLLEVAGQIKSIAAAEII
jgi:BirA family transcriptional regulator, biotin operon repressor / biotin---[acetyl-CoA-carboxylase] ligase